MRLQLSEEGTGESPAIREVQQLHNGKALQQVRETSVCDVALRAQLLDHVGAHHVIELGNTEHDDNN